MTRETAALCRCIIWRGSQLSLDFVNGVLRTRREDAGLFVSFWWCVIVLFHFRLEGGLEDAQKRHKKLDNMNGTRRRGISGKWCDTQANRSS
jgi:hypothetical protein